jgi:hypothetical protein
MDLCDITKCFAVDAKPITWVMCAGVGDLVDTRVVRYMDRECRRPMCTDLGEKSASSLTCRQC